MLRVEEIRNGIIEKILSINNEDFLLSLDRLIETSKQVDIVDITPQQRKYLEMSEDDILAGRIISEEEMREYDAKWQSEK